MSKLPDASFGDWGPAAGPTGAAAATAAGESKMADASFGDWGAGNKGRSGGGSGRRTPPGMVSTAIHCL